MNAFEYIDEMIEVIERTREDKAHDKSMLTLNGHYNEMINMLSTLRTEMEHAEYNYQVESIKHKIETFDEMVVLQKDLSSDVLIFQPIAIGEAELSAVDMQSLADVLKQLHDNGTIKENIILLPPNINVFRAKLALPKTTEEEVEDESRPDWEE